MVFCVESNFLFLDGAISPNDNIHCNNSYILHFFLSLLCVTLNLNPRICLRLFNDVYQLENQVMYFSMLIITNIMKAFKKVVLNTFLYAG